MTIMTRNNMKTIIKLLQKWGKELEHLQKHSHNEQENSAGNEKQEEIY